jgi:hypothetical protein
MRVHSNGSIRIHFVSNLGGSAENALEQCKVGVLGSQDRSLIVSYLDADTMKMSELWRKSESFVGILMFWLYIGEGVHEVPLIYGSCSTPETLFTSRVFMGVGVDILDSPFTSPGLEGIIPRYPRKSLYVFF